MTRNQLSPFNLWKHLEGCIWNYHRRSPRYEIQVYSAFFGKLDDAIQNPSDTQSGQAAWKIQVTSRTKRHERLLFSWDLLQNTENLWKSLGVRVRDRCVSIPIPFESASRLTQEKLVVYAEGNLSSRPILRVDHLRFHLYKLSIVGLYDMHAMSSVVVSYLPSITCKHLELPILT